MKRFDSSRLVAALALLLFALPLSADFTAVARAIQSERGVRRTWIPFLGFARTMVRIAQPEGVRDFQLAVFTGAERVDARQLQAIMRSKAGAGFSPLVQVRSRRSGEWSFIYARPYANGNRVELLVLAHDDEETVLVRVDVDAERIARHISVEPRGVTTVAAR